MEDFDSDFSADSDLDDMPQDPPVGYHKPLDLVPRSAWGAVEPKSRITLLTPVDYIILSYTGTDPCHSDEECERAVREMQREHMQEKGMPDIQWNFLVGGNAKVYEGRGWNTIATKAEEHRIWDYKSLDVMYIGRYRSEVTLEMKDMFNELIHYGLENNLIEQEIEEFREYTDYHNREVDYTS